MTTDFTDVRHNADLLVAEHGARDTMFEEIRQMFHMEWSKYPAGDWIKPTMSPGAFNAVVGTTRLMTSTEPSVSVPFDESDAGSRQISETLERAAKAMWGASGRVQQRPPHYDLIFSGVLFAEMAASVTSTADLLKYAIGSDDKRNIKRMTAIAKRAPYLFQTYNPATFYPELDNLGIRGGLHRVTTTWGAVQDQWGKLTEPLRFPGTNAIDRSREVVLNDWYDWEQRVVWVEDVEGSIVHDDHGLEFMPIVHGITEGSTIFNKPEQQRWPMLYAMWKSGLWKRENLSLTMIFSMIFTLGTNPLLVYEGEDEDKLKIDRSLPGNIVRIPPGRKLYPLAEKVLDQAQTYGLDIARNTNEESTISKQALGAPPKDALAFSAINLLVQAGRLPLMGVKQMGGKVVAELLTQALYWWGKEGGDGAKLYDKGGAAVDLKRGDVPDNININVGLEPDLPTDKLNLANVGERLVSAKLASRRWVRENILNIGQSDAMDKEQWTEERALFELAQRLEKLAAENKMSIEKMAQQMQMQQQAMMQKAAGAQAPQGPGAGGPPAGDMGGMSPRFPRQPPEQQPASAYPPGGVGEGQPLATSLPPRSGPGAQPGRQG